LQKRM